MRVEQPKRNLRTSGVLDKMGNGRSYHHELVVDGLMVKPIKQGNRIALYPEHEVDAIMEAIVAGKDKDEIRDLVKLLEASRKTDPVATFLSLAKSPDQIKVTITKLQSHLETLRGAL